MVTGCLDTLLYARRWSKFGSFPKALIVAQALHDLIYVCFSCPNVHAILPTSMVSKGSNKNRSLVDVLIFFWVVGEREEACEQVTGGVGFIDTGGRGIQVSKEEGGWGGQKRREVVCRMGEGGANSSFFKTLSDAPTQRVREPPNQTETKSRKPQIFKKNLPRQTLFPPK